MTIAELLRSALAELAAKAPERPPILVGGVAMILHGSDRLTKDIDVAFQDGWEVISTLYSLGFKAVSSIDQDENGRMTKATLFPDGKSAFEKTLSRKALTFIHADSRAQFDVWLVSPLPYQKLLEHSVFAEFEGLTVRVASLEDLLELKRIARSANPQRTADLADILFLEARLRSRGD
jgi:hypothetical protein